MSDNKYVEDPPRGEKTKVPDTDTAVSTSEISSVADTSQTAKTHSRVSSSSDRQIKFERAQKCLENAALVSKRIKEHRKATAELLGRPFEDDDVDKAAEVASTMSEKTGYSVATDTSTTLSVQEALNIPGISESLANTLKQKELLMERIKQYKEISKRTMKTSTVPRSPSVDTKLDIKKGRDHTDVTQLINTLKEKENALSVIQVKMKAMETTILDLQEKIAEKDQIIEAKNKATTLMSDSLSKKEKDSLALLEDTRQQMIKMQENFVNMELEWKEERNKLLNQIEEKDEKIASLEEANTILENSRFEISVAHSNLIKELKSKEIEILELQEKIDKMSHENVKEEQKLTQKEKEDSEEEKGSKEIADMMELTKKVELLEQLNCQIRQTNKELENKLSAINPEPKTTTTGSPSKKGSPLPTRKGARSTAKSKSPWSQLSSESIPQEVEKKPIKGEVSKLEMVVQSLNKDILDKEYLISQKDTLISELKAANAQSEILIQDLKLQVHVPADVVHVAVCTEPHSIQEEVAEYVESIESNVSESHLPTDVPGLMEKLKKAQDQIVSLNNEIDAANKNMVKVKSTHKLKLKQMQKTIDNFSKVSDAHAEIVKLNEDLHQLSQRVAELEEEKGNLQLHLVDYDSGRLTESDIYKKMVEMETLAEARLKSISVLEAQKFDLVQELHELKQKNVEMEDKLADMSHLHSEQVSSEMKSVQLEEQIDQLNSTIKELELINENFKLNKEHLEGTVRTLEEEKEELLHKLENYIQENMELTDKLEKLSAEKVSSAESIEIVESLTTQEKLELEEYNKRLPDHKKEGDHAEMPVSSDCQENIQKLVEQSAELNKKIELFTQERQEVMEKMNQINTENELLHGRMLELSNQCNNLQSNIELLNKEKHELTSLNDELTRQIEELKRERLDIMKESVEMVKAPSTEETVEGTTSETQTDDKAMGEKGINRTKSVKQLTKEILKLKNIIKEREAEIGDCQMKILSLEEQHQKQNDFIQINASYETKIRNLIDENQQLKEEVNNVRKEQQSEQLAQSKHVQEMLQQEIQKLHNEYASALNHKDARIQELESHLLEYEKQIFNYGNTLQQKDKEMAEYINKIAKLNDVSQKLKSTIELLEEEKAKDPNAELVKSLNKQITALQKKLVDSEDKLRKLEDERAQLITVKGALENKIIILDAELKKMQETFIEKQNLIKELQLQQQKHNEEMSSITLELKERDEEVHEIKLQLRKESIENEKLRTTLQAKESHSNVYVKQIQAAEEQAQKLSIEKDELSEKCQAVETANKELTEKLKKFAAAVKKKSSMYVELEHHLHETEKDLQAKNLQLEQLLIQVDTLPALQEKLKYAEEELNRLQSQKANIEQQKSQDVLYLQNEMKTLQEKLNSTLQELHQISQELQLAQKELSQTNDENINLKSHIETLNNKLADFEVEQKNSMNFVTKISSMEADINQKQDQIAELLSKLEDYKQQLGQVQFGQEAKIQERDLYIESLENEIEKYKSRICRLEESISVMEDRRHTLERKADQLGSQLQEKQKAYSEYTSQEDQLVSRLAALMDHDRVVEKQLHEIENENKELLHKIQHFSEENQHLRRALSDIQNHCNTLGDKASRTDFAESELAKYQSQFHELDTQLKRVTQEHQHLLAEKKREIEEIEGEFNTQIENAIREKKILSEKYEKRMEHTAQLEKKLQEYKINIETLQINIEELNKMNRDFIEKSSREQPQIPDYTEQYISEINKLNAVINNKNEEIRDLQNKLQSLHNSRSATVSNMEQNISELNDKLKHSSTIIDQLVQESNTLKASNEQQQKYLLEKEEQIKRLMDEKRVTFEMTIPKTEGMVILSTIEPLYEDVNQEPNVSSIESQIVLEGEPIVDDKPREKHTKQLQKSSEGIAQPGEVIEPVMVAKQAYLCYKEDENLPEQSVDPFNSDEGWGLGEEEGSEVTPGLTHLTEQIQQLKNQNEKLKSDIDASQNKLVKAMRKIKELKTNNDMLSNELKLSKQMSQSSFLDSAIEDELKINIQELEKKLEELTADLTKEKKEKDSLRKQNEVFHNANERLTEMKEKLDNEIELWKFKFKEANDRMSTFQWDSKDSPGHKPEPKVGNIKGDVDELLKLEKENDELQLVIDQLTSQNKELSIQQSRLEIEVSNLNKQMQENSNKKENQEILNNKVIEFQNLNSELKTTNDILSKKLNSLESLYNEMSRNCESLDNKRLELQNANDKLIEEVNHLETQIREMENMHKQLNDANEHAQKACNEKISTLEARILSLNQEKNDATKNVSALKSELETTKSKLLWLEQEQTSSKLHNVDHFAMSEQLSAVQDFTSQLKRDLEVVNNKVLVLEAEKQNLLQTLRDYEQKIVDLNAEVQHLHSENKQLLSTIESLRLSAPEPASQLFEKSESKVLESSFENQDLVQKAKEYEQQVVELNAKIQHLNTENDQLLSTVAELRSSISSAVDQRGFEIAELWKQHLAQREADFQKTEQELRSELNAFEAKYEQLLDTVQSSSQEETNKLVIMEQVTSLQNKLQDKEEHLRNLQDKYAEIMNQIDMIRSEAEDEKIMYENKLLTQQEEYEKRIQETTDENLKHSQEYELVFSNLQSELAATKAKNDESKQQIQELLMNNDSLNKQVEELSNLVRLKDNEIYQKTNEISIALNQRNEEFENVRQQLLDYEKKIEELTYEKEAELAVLRLKIHKIGDEYEKALKDNEEEKLSLTQEINAKIVECTNLNKQITDFNKKIEVHSKEAAEMQAVLESQELEIVTLKDEIANLQEMLRISTSKVEKHVTFASDTKQGDEIAQKSAEEVSNELLDPIPRAELDLALYMLHQRDVRCEELTMELTQLLEERDTLQIRLSDSLRSLEEMKSRCESAGLDVSVSASDSVSELPTFSMEREQHFVDVHRGQTSRSSSISEPDGDKPKLQAKLTELRSVRHSRDVRLRQDSEQRQLDLRLLQRDVANLPPEAREQLAQAHHTLTRDSQSTSTVLLNWLRGKTTPKVVHM